MKRQPPPWFWFIYGFASALILVVLLNFATTPADSSLPPDPSAPVPGMDFPAVWLQDNETFRLLDTTMRKVDLTEMKECFRIYCRDNGIEWDEAALDAVTIHDVWILLPSTL